MDVTEKHNSIIVRKAPSINPSRGLLQLGDRTWPCILGKNGISPRKFEGDMKTPSGSFRLLFGFYRIDRVNDLNTLLPMRAINPGSGWCDDPLNANYNRPVKLPFRASHEVLLRKDRLYDIVIVMDHNFSKRTRNRGSAVFFHLTDGKPYTAGCIAISADVMKQLLPRLSKNTKMVIKA